MTVLVRIHVISMNRLCKGDSAIAKQWLVFAPGKE